MCALEVEVVGLSTSAQRLSFSSFSLSFFPSLSLSPSRFQGLAHFFYYVVCLLYVRIKLVSLSLFPFNSDCRRPALAEHAALSSSAVPVVSLPLFLLAASIFLLLLLDVALARDGLLLALVRLITRSKGKGKQRAVAADVGSCRRLRCRCRRFRRRCRGRRCFYRRR